MVRLGSRPPARWRPARARLTARLTAGLTAGLAAAGLLAGCSGTGGPAGPPASHGTGPAARRSGLAARGWSSGQGGPVGVIQVPGSGGSYIVAVGGAGGGIVVGPGLAGSSGRPQITVGPIPPPGSDQVIDLPLNTYADVAEVQQTTLAEASTLLTQQCMAARGFVYTSQASPSQVQTLFQTAEYGFGVTSPADASTYGYGQPKNSATRPGPAFLGGFSTFGDLAKQPRAWVQALLGFAPGARIGRVRQPGCLQQASQELYARGGLSDPVPQIAFQASQWTQSDPRVRAVDAAWSRCMAQAGYHYASPQQAADRGWPSKPTAAETATATADVRCKQQVNLANTWLTVEAAYQTALIRENLATLTSLQSSFSKLLTRAEFLLTAGSLSAR